MNMQEDMVLKESLITTMKNRWRRKWMLRVTLLYSLFHFVELISLNKKKWDRNLILITIKWVWKWKHHTRHSMLVPRVKISCFSSRMESNFKFYLFFCLCFAQNHFAIWTQFPNMVDFAKDFFFSAFVTC